MKHGTLNGIPSPAHDLYFNTVGELIDWLGILGRERSIMINLDGSTFPVYARYFTLWDENLKDSPVSLNVPLDWEG